MSIFSFLAILAQIAMACTAVFAYFFTVVPIYQKEQLAENVVKLENNVRTLEIEKQQIEVASQKKLEELAILKADFDAITKDKTILLNDIVILATEKDKTNNNLVKLEQEFKKVSNDTQIARTELKSTYRKLYLEGMESCAFMQTIIWGQDHPVDRYKIKTIEDVSSIASFSISPYNAIKTCISTDTNYFESMSVIPVSDRKELASNLLKYLERDKDLKKTGIGLDLPKAKGIIATRDAGLKNTNKLANKFEEMQAEAMVNHDFSRNIGEFWSEQDKKFMERVSHFFTEYAKRK